MHQSPARWASAVATAALLTLPLAASAQTPAQPETKPDITAAKQHLTDARDTLSQLTAMPEAARLQGDTRAQVSQLISNFNELITTQSDWKAAYGKLDATLSTLLGPSAPDPATAASGVAGATGTSGTTTAQLDPAVRGKLVEFRTHLKAFEKAVTAAPATSAATSTSTSASATTAPPPAATSTPPASAAPPAMVPADQAKMTEQVNRAEAGVHLDAISAVLDQAQAGTLTKEQTAELRKHVESLRALLKK